MARVGPQRHRKKKSLAYGIHRQPSINPHFIALGENLLLRFN